MGDAVELPPACGPLPPSSSLSGPGVWSPTHRRPLSLLSVPCSVEGEAPSSETGTSLDSPSAYRQGSLAPASSLSPDRYEHASVGAYGLYSGPPGQQQRTRRPKLQHSTSILRKQAEEEAIKRSRSLSESYELSSDLQDKQVSGARLGNRWGPGRIGSWVALAGDGCQGLCWASLRLQEAQLSHRLTSTQVHLCYEHGLHLRPGSPFCSARRTEAPRAKGLECQDLGLHPIPCPHGHAHRFSGQTLSV